MYNFLRESYLFIACDSEVLSNLFMGAEHISNASEKNYDSALSLKPYSSLHVAFSIVVDYSPFSRHKELSASIAKKHSNPHLQNSSEAEAISCFVRSFIIWNSMWVCLHQRISE